MKNDCDKCKNHIDKSDSHTTWITINRKWYYVDDIKVPNKRILLCGDCGLKILSNEHI